MAPHRFTQPVDLAIVLRQIRMLRGLNQKEFAKNLGLSARSTQRLESGHSTVDFKSFVNLAASFQISPGSLFEWTAAIQGFKIYRTTTANLRKFNVKLLGRFFRDSSWCDPAKAFDQLSNWNLFKDHGKPALVCDGMQVRRNDSWEKELPTSLDAFEHKSLLTLLQIQKIESVLAIATLDLPKPHSRLICLTWKKNDQGVALAEFSPR